jgi:hypothetical protein
MSERPNDAPDGQIEEPEGQPPIDDEATDLEAEGAPEPDGFDDDLDEAADSEPEPATPDEAAAKAAEADVHRDRGLRPSERRATRAAERTQIPIDETLRIKDRASALFVLLVVAVFGIIVLNSLILGRGGLLTPLPTLVLPTPIVTPAPTVAPSVGPTVVPSVAPSPTPGAS